MGNEKLITLVNGREDFSEVENILVTHIKVDVDEEIKYGENITMSLDLPATSDTLIINGKKQEINSTTEEFTYPLTDLTYGENYIIIEYGGEKLNKTVTMTIEGDGEEIYQSPAMSVSSKPVDVEVDLSKYNDVKFHFLNDSGKPSNGDPLCLGTPYFYLI